MRKLIIALFAIGLLFAFTAPAYAYNVDLTGYYRIRGFWYNNEAVSDERYNEPLTRNRAYMDQRLRLQFTVNIAEGLSFTGRFHAMDRIFEGNATVDQSNTIDTKANIYWNRVYMTFMTGIGQFQLGYQKAGTFGTLFGDTESDGRARLLYTTKFGDFTFLALTEKLAELDGKANVGLGYGAGSVAYPFAGGGAPLAAQDADQDTLALAAIYGWANGNAGLLYYYIDHRGLAANIPPPGGLGLTYPGYVNAKVNLLTPYFKVTYGDLYMEGQYYYVSAENSFDYTTAVGALPDQDREGHSWYILGKYGIGAGHVGFQYAYVSGDDPFSADDETGWTGDDYNPTLLLWNDDTAGLGNRWDATPGVNAYTGPLTGAAMTNASLIQIFGGYTVHPKLELKAALTFAWADEVAPGWDDDIGTELDLEATYKIMDNLEYWIGFGYLFAGDYFKAGVPGYEVDDAWLVMHKIQLNF